MLLGLGLATLLAGCQVRPLYDETSGVSENLAAIAYSDAGSRVGLEVRNRLIFLTGGGAGETKTPQYRVELNITSSVMGVELQKNTDNPNVGRVTVTGSYTLKRISDDVTLRTARRQTTALVDFPEQEFAKVRAIRDGEDRAAHQLADLIKADLAATLGR
ncbi:hypothetical protein ACO34A_22420 [Rhizobium sp. ACO-34A]|nr:hypothetical protein [Rhizobium sp. ACO-34A]ATN36547.1 hypothetical protein ACO34A_22420 [Rhizobium sp. ACO-34A]